MKKIGQFWDDSIVPALTEYIRIPAKSPHFDKAWKENGYIDAAVKLAEDWARKNAVQGMKMEVVRLENRTPVLFIEIEGKSKGNVLMYGHLDKQPEMVGWREGYGPWKPHITDGKLYGRGGADDGYAVFCALSAIRHLHEEKIAHPRITILIETCEESGSYDLPAYLEFLSPRIQTPDLVIGLDSGCGNYEQLWGTTSLRGLVNGTLTVEVLTEGVHSGDASGVVASSFRVLRQLLERVDNADTGVVRHAVFHAPIPPERFEQAKAAAKVLGGEIWKKFPFVEGMRPMNGDLADLVLNRTWRPALSITGADGLPPLDSAGNVLRPKTSLALSLRLPPTVDGEKAAHQLKLLLEADPPYGAKVLFEYGHGGSGWHAPRMPAGLEKIFNDVSQKHYGKPAMYMGEGGTIPFMAMLGVKFPQAQFFITGVLGPHSNAHGPNEFLHIDYAKRLTACVADVLSHSPDNYT